jgi:hypothetical protein
LFLFFLFFISTTVIKLTRRIQGTLKEKEESIPKQGGMDELKELNDETEVGMQLEVNLVAAQSAT